VRLLAPNVPGIEAVRCGKRGEDRAGAHLFLPLPGRPSTRGVWQESEDPGIIRCFWEQFHSFSQYERRHEVMMPVIMC
jgi:hypothetical protein